MVQVLEMLAPRGSNCRPLYRLPNFIGVTIHETANRNPTAGALNHAKYLQGSGQYNSVSWHYAVDDHLITRSIPEDEIAWHAGDGRSGNGNLKTISIEICVNQDSNIETARRNAAELAADILKRHNIYNAKASLFMHKDWSGKNCPTIIISEGRWPEFNALVQRSLNGLQEEESEFKQAYRVYKSLPGYYSASDAIKGINAKTILSPGNYYVFKEVEAAINITKTANVPGAWIDAFANARAKLEEIKVGTEVKLAGYVYADSLGDGQSNVTYEQTGTITRIADVSRPYPFHFETLGWVEADAIETALETLTLSALLKT